MTEEFIQAQSEAERDFGDWHIGRYAWRLENIEVLKNPVKLSGKQGLWNF